MTVTSLPQDLSCYLLELVLERGGRAADLRRVCKSWRDSCDTVVSNLVLGVSAGEDEFVRNADRWRGTTSLCAAACPHLTADGLQAMNKLRLKELDLSQNSQLVTSAGAHALGGFQTLTKLSLLDCHVTIEFLHSLSTMTELRCLQLGRRPNLPNLASLQHMPKLLHLSLLQMPYFSDQEPGLQVLTRLTGLELTGHNRPDEALSAIAQLTRLQVLNLENTPVADHHLSQLAPLSQSLRSLLLQRAVITEAGLVALEGFSVLERLSLERCYNVHEQGVSSIMKLASLQHLNMEGCDGLCSDDGMRNFSLLRSLQSLKLPCSGLQMPSFLENWWSPALVKLSIPGSGLQPAVISQLCCLTRLKSLCIDSMRATAETLQAFRPMQQLTFLGLLHLYMPKIADATAWKHLIHCIPNAVALDMHNAFRLTKEHAALLPFCKRLRMLNLNGCISLENLDFSILTSLTGLTQLNLNSALAYAANHSDGEQRTDTLGPTTLASPVLPAVTNTKATERILYGNNSPRKQWEQLCNFAALQRLPDLADLSLKECDVMGKLGFEVLAGLTQLTRLDLSKCTFTPEGLAQLQTLPHLAVLILADGKQRVTDAGALFVARITSLTSLDLSRSEITDASLAAIGQQLRGLRELILMQCLGFTDAGLGELAGLARLTRLALMGCKGLTGAAIDDLRRKLGRDEHFLFL